MESVLFILFLEVLGSIFLLVSELLLLLLLLVGSGWLSFIRGGFLFAVIWAYDFKGLSELTFALASANVRGYFVLIVSISFSRMYLGQVREDTLGGCLQCMQLIGLFHVSAL